MNNGCIKCDRPFEELYPNLRDGVVKVIDVSDPSVNYEVRRLREYCKHLKEIASYGTLVSIKPYTLVIDSLTNPKAKDYYYVIEALEDVADYVDGIHTFCVILSNDQSPINSIWENK